LSVVHSVCKLSVVVLLSNSEPILPKDSMNKFNEQI
jgi:hypothetical protein